LATNKDQTTSFAEGDLEKSEGNYLIALGAKAKQFFFETRFEAWPRETDDIFFSNKVRVKRLSFIVGYNLNMKKSK
jgi:hypothetical protein